MEDINVFSWWLGLGHTSDYFALYCCQKMKDQVMVDEMGKQPRISVHGPRGKKNPLMGQDAPTKPDPLQKTKSGLPRPWNTAPSSNNTCSLQLRLQKSSQEVAKTHIPICSSIPVKEGPRLTLSTRVCRPASRIPCPVSRFPNPGRSSGCHIRLKGGQGEKPERVQKNQNPSLGPPSGLPPSVHAKGIVTSTKLPLKTEETSSTLIQSSFMTFNNSPALLPTYQVLKEQHGEDISSLALLSPSGETKVIALLPPDDLDLSIPEFVSDEVVASKTPHCKKHISNLALKFPESNVQMEMLPNNLSKTGKIPVKYPHLSTLPKRPIPSSPTSLDFLSRIGQKQGSSKKKLGMFGSISSTFSTKEFQESITGSPPSQDFVSSNRNDIPDTKILSPSYPLSSSSGLKEMVLSVFHDVNKEEESSRTQIFTDIGSSDTSALSSEEKVLGRMEEEFNSGNGCDPNESTSKYNLCILL